MQKHDTDAAPKEGHIWFAIIGSQIGSYCRDDTSIESAVKRVTHRWRLDFKDLVKDHKTIDVCVYELPDAETISWDHEGFWIDNATDPLAFLEAGARCFLTDVRHGNIIEEWAWQAGRGWV